jgi:tetratricopeptide (TPR) repeat protein
MLSECPVAQLRDPKRALVLALRARELGHVGWGEVAVAQVAAGQYPEALETCAKASRAGQQTMHLTYCTALAYWHLGRQAEARELLRQIVQQVGNQQNQYWYTAEYRWRARETAKLMGLEIEDLKSVDPEKALRNGIALYRRLAEERPGDRGLLPEVTRRYTELYGLLSNGGREGEAQQLAREAIEVVTRLAGDCGVAPACRDNLARFHHDLGLFQAQHAQHEEALKNQTRAAHIWGALADDVPGEPGYRVHQANVLVFHLAPLLAAVGRAREAEDTYRQAIREWERLTAEFPATADYRSSLGAAVGSLANFFMSTQRVGDAEQLCTQAIENRPDLAGVHEVRGRIYSGRKQPDKALNDFSKAIELEPRTEPGWYRERADTYAALQQPDRQLLDLSKAVELWPDRFDVWVWRGEFHFNRQEWATAIADLSRAIELNEKYWPAWQMRGTARTHLNQWEQALNELRKLIDREPADIEVLKQVAGHPAEFARLLAERNHREEGEQFYSAALQAFNDACERLSQRTPADPTIRRIQARVWRGRGGWLLDLRRPADSVEALRRAVDLYAGLTEPDDRAALGHSLWALAGALFAVERKDEAEQTLHRAVEVFDALAADFPKNFFYRQEHGFANWQVGWMMNQLGRPLDAEEPFRRALAVHRQLAQDAPKIGEYQLRLGRSYGELLRLLWSAGRSDEAARLAEDAIDTLSTAAREHGDVAASRDGLARFHHDYGILQRQSRQNQDALKSFQQAASIWGKLADDVQGEPAYRLHQVNVLTGDLPPLLAAAGRVTELDGFAQGLTDLREFMKRHPDQPDGRRLALARAHLHWGAWQWRAARREEAHVTLDQATEIERDNWQIFIERGNLWLILNEAARAIGDYSGALEHVQDAASQSFIHLQRGSAHSRLGRHAEARDDWQKAVELAPTSAEANNNLAWLLATCADTTLRDPRRAVALATKGVELQPKQGMYWNTLGAARYGAGDWAAAVEALSKSMELRQGGDAFDWFFLAMAEWQRGNKDEARRWYDKAREWTQRNAAANEELQRFEAEAKGVLEAK